MDREILAKQNTPKLFFYLTLSMISLVLVYYSVIQISFNLIEHFIKNVSVYTKMRLASDNRFGISMLIVNLPVLYLSCMAVRCGAARSKFSQSSKLINWVIYGVLGIFAIIVIIDLSCLIYWFLAGDLATSTVVKVVTVLIAAIVTMGCVIVSLKDIAFLGRNIFFAVSMIILISPLAIALKYYPSRSESIQMRADIKKVASVSYISRIVLKYYEISKVIPANLDQLLTEEYFTAKEKDAINKKEVSYQLINENSFKLCADFTYPAGEIENNFNYHYTDRSSFSRNQYGDKCFIYNLQAARKGGRSSID